VTHYQKNQEQGILSAGNEPEGLMFESSRDLALDTPFGVGTANFRNTALEHRKQEHRLLLLPPVMLRA